MLNKDQTPRWARKRNFDLPFTVELGDGSVLTCDTALRVLPARRVVCSGHWCGQAVFAKLYLGQRGAEESRTEARVLSVMRDWHLPAPELLVRTTTQRHGFTVLLTTAIAGAVTWKQAWQQANAEQRQGLLATVCRLLSQQHVRGLLQIDMHLDNFLVTPDGAVLAVDTASHLTQKGPVPTPNALQNLAAFFAKFSGRVFEESSQVLEMYRQATVDLDSDAFASRLKGYMRQEKRLRRRRLRKKIFGNCSEFLRRPMGSLHIMQRRDLPVAALDAWMADSQLAPRSNDEWLKKGASSSVWRTSLDGRSVVVKRYNLKNWQHYAKRMLRRSRASKSWENAHLLRIEGIDTPLPLALIEERRYGLHQRAWLITEWSPNLTALQWFAELDDPSRLQRGAEALLGMLRDMGAAGIVHGDTKGTNFLLDEQGRVEVIDLDSLSWPEGRRLRQGLARDRCRFYRNWVGGTHAGRFEALLGDDNFNADVS